MSVGGIAPNAGLIVPEGKTAGEVRAEAAASGGGGVRVARADAEPLTHIAGGIRVGSDVERVAGHAPARLADTFTPSSPGIAIPERSAIHAPTSSAYHDLTAAKRELRQARHEPAGTPGRRADIREARRDVRHAKAALNAETSGAGTAGLHRDAFGEAILTRSGAVIRPGVDDNFADFDAGVDAAVPGNDGAVGPGFGHGKGHAYGRNLPPIDQLNPAGNDGTYTNGDMNCAPAALAMIARAHPDMMLDGIPVGQLSDAELVSAIGRHSDTNNQGTAPNSLVNAAEDMGFLTSGYRGGFDSNYYDSVLAQGGSVIANGAYYIGDQLAGHFVTVAAKNYDGTYVVNDPLQGRVVWTADELNRFLRANPHNGGVSIGVV
jgi:hypothetical protein